MGSMILVAEDEKDIREFLALALQVNGFDVVQARNGEEAVELVNLHKPDLVLLDIRMPKVTGYQACETLKSEPSTKEIPVVFLSAYANKEEIDRGLGLGAEEYLTKPIAPDVLVQRVGDVLRRLESKKSRARLPAMA